MRVFRLPTCAILAVLLSAVACGGGGGGIEGTVTVGGEPAEGVSVQLLPGGAATGATGPATNDEVDPLATTTTDAEGHFSLDADPGEYSLSVQDLQLEGAPGACNALMPFITVEEGSTATADFDVPAEPPSGGLTFVDPFWFACFAA